MRLAEICTLMPVGKKITEHETCISAFILCAPQFVCMHAKHLIKHNSLQAATF